MAHLICGASGNLTSSGTWCTVDSTALVTEGGIASTTLTTTSQNSASFTPGAITVDALAVKLLSRGTGTPTNTLTVVLYDATSSSAVVTLNIPVADLPVSNNGDLMRGGWVLFSLGGSQSLTAGKNYQVRMNLNNTSTAVIFMTNGTAANWQHMLRTTTTAAPAATDNMWIIGLWTASATWTLYTVTQDQTTTGTVYGSNPGAAETAPGEKSGLHVYRSSLVWPTTSSTALALAGNLVCGHYSTVSMGTVAAPVERAYTAVLQFNTTTAYGVKVGGGVFSAVGESPTSGKNVNWTILTNSATSGSTASLTVRDDTGWTSGSQFFVATTRRNQNDYAQYTLAAAAGTNSLTPSAAMSANYAGSASGWPFPATIALTAGYNVIIQSDAATRYTYLRCEGNATTNQRSTLTLQWVRLLYTNVYHNLSNTVSIKNCVSDFQKTTILGNPHFRAAGGVLTSCEWKDVVAISHASNWMFYFDFGNGTDLSACSVENLISIAGNSSGGHYIQWGNWTMCRGLRSNGGNACYLTVVSNNNHNGSPPSDMFSGSWFLGPGGTGAVTFQLSTYRDVTLSNIAACGTTASVYFTGGALHENIVWKNCVLWAGGAGGSGVIDTINFDCGLESMTFDESTIGGSTSDSQAPTRLFVAGVNQTLPIRLKFLNCTFSNSLTTPPSGTGLWLDRVGDSTSSRIRLSALFTNPTGLDPTSGFVGTTASYFSPDSYVSIANFAGTDGDNRTILPWYKNGATSGVWTQATRRNDTTTYNTAAPSEMLIPVTTASKLPSSVKRFAVTSGSTASLSVYVCKDSTYDGAAPRLVLRRHDIAGYNADQVLDTHSVAADTWEQLTSTIGPVSRDAVLEVVVDCDGTTGSVYVDDWAVA